MEVIYDELGDKAAKTIEGFSSKMSKGIHTLLHKPRGPTGIYKEAADLHRRYDLIDLVSTALSLCTKSAKLHRYLTLHCPRGESFRSKAIARKGGREKFNQNSEMSLAKGTLALGENC